jgi:hypothetical protein
MWGVFSRGNRRGWGGEVVREFGCGVEGGGWMMDGIFLGGGFGKEDEDEKQLRKKNKWSLFLELQMEFYTTLETTPKKLA